MKSYQKKDIFGRGVYILKDFPHNVTLTLPSWGGRKQPGPDGHRQQENDAVSQVPSVAIIVVTILSPSCASSSTVSPKTRRHRLSSRLKHFCQNIRKQRVETNFLWITQTLI